MSYDTYDIKREKINSRVVIDSTSCSPTLNFSVLYASTPPSSKSFLSTSASIDPADSAVIPTASTSVDIKCEPTIVHFDPWQVPNPSNSSLVQLSPSPDSIVTSIKTPLPTSILHSQIENVNISKCEVKKSNFGEGGIN